jgi:hypothetical protein
MDDDDDDDGVAFWDVTLRQSAIVSQRYKAT